MDKCSQRRALPRPGHHQPAAPLACIVGRAVLHGQLKKRRRPNKTYWLGPRFTLCKNIHCIAKLSSPVRAWRRRRTTRLVRIGGLSQFAPHAARCRHACSAIPERVRPGLWPVWRTGPTSRHRSAALLGGNLLGVHGRCGMWGR
ncbi:hypothetical protein SETIT_7G200800v2 [Setaria italica]|uniref:Uncharacterized protein n=1 Tax=Setaria italica TaxID=4555 RepID=A0A368RXY8_SETIT|nr:hypothetical protein SETIT_7G200800v2 [Setaria italica]